MIDYWNSAAIPPNDDRYILLSYSNYSLPDIGQYRRDEDGSGAYYPGDDDRSCISYGLFVNGWMELPPCRSDEDDSKRID